MVKGLERLFRSAREGFGTLKWLLGERTGKKYIYIIISTFLLANLEIVFLTLTYLLLGKIVSGKPQELPIGPFSTSKLTLINITALMIVTLILRSFTSIYLKYYTTKILASRESEISIFLTQRSLFEKRDSYKANNSADFLQIFTGIIPTIFTNVLNPLIGLIYELFSTIFIITAAINMLTHGGTWVFSYLILAALVIALPVGKYMKNMNKEVLELNKSTLKKFLEFNRIREELLLSHHEDSFLMDLQSQQKKLVGTRALLSVVVSIPRHLMELSLIAGFVILLIFNDNQGNSSAQLKSIGVLVAVGFRVLPPINSLIVNYSIINGGYPNVAKMRMLSVRFNNPKKLIPEFPTRNFAKTLYKGDLVLDKVSYVYPASNKKVISNLSFEVPECTTLWIKGPSGTGKTTLVGLVAGFLNVTSGELYLQSGSQRIAIDEQITGLSYLGQEVPLLDASFAHNIALQSTSLSDLDRLRAACLKAGILDRILASPNSFDSIVGENGSQLSAGERQRLGLARSIYANPRLLILDEPTANLDYASEKVIWNSLQELKGQITMLVVSHRKVPSTLFDSVLELNVRSKNV